MINQNYAFIDGNNLYLGAKSQNISLNYGKFRKYLRDKMSIDKAFLFIGYDPKNIKLYQNLKKYGFTIIFKPTVKFTNTDGSQLMKGNVDAELVLYAAAIEYSHYNKAVIVSSDGDFACLIKFLDEKNKILKIITPTSKYSKLLKPFVQYILPLKVIEKQVNEH